jgi:hypothetical protein
MVLLVFSVLHGDLKASEHQLVVLNGNINFANFEQDKTSLSAMLHQTVTGIALQNNLKVSNWSPANGQCDSSFCGYSSLAQLQAAVLSQSASEAMDVSPSISVIINVNGDASLGIQAVDLVSQELLSSIKLNLPEQLASTSSLNEYTSALEKTVSDASLLVFQQLKQSKKLYQVLLKFKELSKDETQAIQSKLTGLASHMSAKLELKNSSVSNAWLGGNWFLQFDSQFELLSQSTPTRVWQSITPVTQELDLIVSFDNNEILVTRQGTAFMAQKSALIALVLLVMYLLVNYVWWQIMSVRLQVLSTQSEVSRWLMLYKRWYYSPFYLPDTIKRQAVDIKQQQSLCQQYTSQIKQALLQQNWQQAQSLLTQVKSLDQSHESIPELEQAIASHNQTQQSLERQNDQVKSALSSAVSALSQGNVYHAYYFCHLAKAQCSSTQYQEIAALDKLLMKISAAIEDKIDSHGIKRKANITVAYKGLETLSIKDRASQESQKSGIKEVISTAKQLQIGRGNSLIHNDATTLDIHVNHGAVSSLNKHCKIEYQNGVYLCSDLGSKNGTWLNQSLLDTQAQIIEQQAVLSLSAKQATTPLQFRISTDAINQSLKLQLDKENITLYDKAQLNRVWRDFHQIESTHYWLAGEGIYLCYDVLDGFHFCHLHQLESKESILAKLYFEKSWRLSPQKSDEMQDKLFINDAPLIGEVLLDASVNIRFNKTSLSLEYDSIAKLDEYHNA